MEDSHRESISSIRRQKEILGKHQLTSMERTNQLVNWLPITDNPHLMFRNDPPYLSQAAMDSNPDASLNSCLAYFGGDKSMEMGNLGKIHNIVQDGCLLNEFNRNSCLGLLVSEQFPYAPYGLPALPDDDKLKHELEMDLQNHHVDYQIPSLFMYHGNSFDQATTQAMLGGEATS
ncbi:hypothetical protein MLD38_031913 [Melastoma candidum]|uniref:Uncharacterized protein n=1 Tax=Melastoma candidum TaxID=119954 RepID=A0ACB9MSA3_9MYRT|nr:hypothetical protein MLD38_031913 [Melastoma candidum]